eukprot:13658641-Alexandrium_andersonii.AAC.1
MPVDPLTKASPLKGSAALDMVITSGLLRLVEESAELKARKQGPGCKSRSVKHSRARCTVGEPPGLEGLG